MGQLERPPRHREYILLVPDESPQNSGAALSRLVEEDGTAILSIGKGLRRQLGILELELSLDRVLQRWAVLLLKQVGPHLNDVVRTDPDEEPVEGAVMKLAECESVADDWLPPPPAPSTDMECADSRLGLAGGGRGGAVVVVDGGVRLPTSDARSPGLSCGRSGGDVVVADRFSITFTTGDGGVICGDASILALALSVTDSAFAGALLVFAAGGTICGEASILTLVATGLASITSGDALSVSSFLASTACVTCLRLGGALGSAAAATPFTAAPSGDALKSWPW